MSSWYWQHSFKRRTDIDVAKMDSMFGKHLGYAYLCKLFEVMGELGGFIPHEDVAFAATMMDIDVNDLQRMLDALVQFDDMEVREEGYFHYKFIDDYTGMVKRSERGRKGRQKQLDDAAAAKKKKKPAGGAESEMKKKARPPVVSEKAKELFSYIDEILSPFDGAQNANRDINPEQADRLIDKWGMQKLTDMCNIYYPWKAGKKTKHNHTDFGTLFRKGNWVEERLLEQTAKYEGKRENKHKIEPMDLSPRQQVAHGIK